MKVDILKAYDNVNWDFLRVVMIALEFPKGLVQLVMTCVSSPSFSVYVSGTPMAISQVLLV